MGLDNRANESVSMENFSWHKGSSHEIIMLDDDDEEDLQIKFDGKGTGDFGFDMTVSEENFTDPIRELVEFTVDEDLKSSDFATNAEKCSKFSWISDYGVYPTETDGMKVCYERIDAARKKNPKIFEKLDAKINSAFKTGHQTHATLWRKMKLRRELQFYISQLWPGVPISLVISGSTVNGCAADDADLDMCLCIPDHNGRAFYNLNRGFATKNLKLVRKRLRTCSLVRRVLLIRAKVPILRILCKKPYAGIEIDLNVNNLIGVHNSHLLHHYSRLDDRFPVLCFAVKGWAKAVGIADASAGMFNSYSLNLMVLHFLQVAADPPVLPNLQKIYPIFFDKNQPLGRLSLFSKLPFPVPEASVKVNQRTVGELFIGFFDYFSRFNYAENAISIRRGKVFPRSELSRSHDKYFVYIEEPFDGLNTARCVTGEKEWLTIQTEILRVRSKLSKKVPSLGGLLLGTSCLPNGQ